MYVNLNVVQCLPWPYTIYYHYILYCKQVMVMEVLGPSLDKLLFATCLGVTGRQVCVEGVYGVYVWCVYVCAIRNICLTSVYAPFLYIFAYHSAHSLHIHSHILYKVIDSHILIHILYIHYHYYTCIL